MIDDLRSRAERKAREAGVEPSAMPDRGSSPETRLIHELQVHQIELEMQNEELRRAEADLESARAKYFDLYDLAPVGYLTISERGVILEANLTAARLLGVPRGALVMAPFTRYLEPQDQDSYYLHRKRLFSTGVPQTIELRLRRASGEQFWARLEATTAREIRSDVEVCRTVVSDISERKRHEEERFQFERELQQIQKVESLARMAGAIAHHFNNQLAVVLSSLELSRAEQRASIPDYLAPAMAATLKAAEMSGLLLTYLGQSSGSHAPVDLAETCRRTVPMLRAAAPQHVELAIDLPAPGPAVNGNPSQLQLMLANLVTNAWEAVGDLHAAVRATIRTVHASEIPAAHRFPVGWKPRDQAYACLEVVDDGCGIEPNEIEKIFDPFFTNKFTGRGLGLPVVLGILHAHSGGLVVETRRGRDSGSAFRVYLPVSCEKVERVRQSPIVAGELTDVRWGGTVLVAEDDDMLRWTSKTVLTRLGFSVLEAKDGLEALEVFRLHKPAIRFVLCDLTMPHMDGWQTLAALRKMSPGLPVILTSGYDEAHVMAEERAERPQAFLPKPYPFDALTSAIRLALATQKG